MPKALGLIETMGFVGVVEAADAAVKAATVELAAVEQTTGGLVTIRLSGDVGAVNAAVDAGANAARKVGQLLSHHVIPNPDEQVRQLLGAGKTSPSGDRLHHPGAPSPPGDPESMSVVELRRLARSLSGIAIRGREISRANRDDLLREIRKLRD